MVALAESCGIAQADGILLDIGVSSHQLDTPQRGFSYHHDASLDMRMSQEGMSAKDLVNTLSWQELAQIISRYGEDKNVKSIAKGIVKAREEAPVETTLQLAEIVKVSVPAAVRREPGHPARKPSKPYGLLSMESWISFPKGWTQLFRCSVQEAGWRLLPSTRWKTVWSNNG